MLEEAKVFLITLSPDCNHFFHKFQWKFWFFYIFPIWMASQNAVSVRISPSWTVVNVYALQTHSNHETDWENRLKQIGPLLNYLLTWRRMPQLFMKLVSHFCSHQTREHSIFSLWLPLPNPQQRSTSFHDNLLYYPIVSHSTTTKPTATLILSCD